MDALSYPYIAHTYMIGTICKEQPLVDHLLQTSIIAHNHADKTGLPYSGELLGIIHDVGKYWTGFQYYLRSASGLLTPCMRGYVDPLPLKGKINHSFAGGQHLWRQWADENPIKRAVAQILSLCVISHHSGLKDCLTPDGTPSFLRYMSRNEDITHHDACFAVCDENLYKAISTLLPVVQNELGTKLLHQYKRLTCRGTSKEIFNSLAVQQGLLVRYLLSCLIDADRTDSANFQNPHWQTDYNAKSCKSWTYLIDRFEKYLVKMNISPNMKSEIITIHQHISHECAQRAIAEQGIFSLSVPTGGGKTLASLRFALRHAERHNLDRVIYVVPYTSIIDQNAAITRAILEDIPDSVVLEHHSDYLPNYENYLESNNRWEHLTENWDAPVIFTTIVQFLETLFGDGTGKMRRMHNLARSVIVFDEVQSLPLKCVNLFCNAIDFLVHDCTSSALFCTATQPELGDVSRQLLGKSLLSQEQEIVLDVPKLFSSLKRTQFITHCDTTYSKDYITQLALKELHEHGGCLVICNTKSSADSIYRKCSQESDHCYLLNTLLCPAHRMDILAAIRIDLHDKKPVLCVSTQLVECGVDISFPSVIRVAAGLDSILQAAGRCNRHGEMSTPGRVHIVRMDEPGLSYLPSIRQGRDIFLNMLATHADALKNTHLDLTQPDLVNEYFRTYFYRNSNSLSYGIGKTQGLNRNDTLLNMLGSNSLACCNNNGLFLRQSFKTASKLFNVIDATTQGIIVPYGEEGKSIITNISSENFLATGNSRHILRKAQRYCVNVFDNELNKLKISNAVYSHSDSNIIFLHEQFYHNKRGIIISAANEPTTITNGEYDG